MKKLKNFLKNEGGFTLIEMLIVIMIISVLLILVVSNLDGVNDTITKTRNDSIIQTVESQLLIYEMEHGTKPNLGELCDKKYITEKQVKAYNQALQAAEKNEKNKN